MGDTVNNAKVIHPAGTIVCRWNQYVITSKPRSTWVIVEPTGPQVRSYWAVGMGWAKTTHRVRIGAEDLITLEQYDRAYRDYCNDQLLKILSR